MPEQCFTIAEAAGREWTGIGWGNFTKVLSDEKMEE